MMFLRWLSLILLTFPGVLCAEVIPVRSGEHPDFTRLVFTLPAPSTKWTLTKTANGYGLNVQAEAVTFDTSTVFDRVPRTRLSGIQTVENLAEFIIDCQCSAKAFQFGEKSVVVDIFEDKEVRPIKAQGEKAPTLKQIAPNLALQSGMNEGLRQKYLEIGSFVAQIESRQGLENELSKHLKSAGEQGLLNFGQSDSPSVQNGMDTQSDDRDAETVGGQSNTNMRALSSVDETLQRKLKALQRLPADECVPDSLLDIATWSDGRPMGEQLGYLRREMVREFDKTDPDTILDLARLYIHFTFGAEARQVLELVEDQQEARLLNALSYLMDGESEVAANFFRKQRLCQGQVHFWAIVAGVSPELTERDAKDMQRQFGAMPTHLRDHLGPLLIGRFLSEGKAASSAQLLKVLERSTQGYKPELVMAKAHIAQAQKKFPKAESILTDLLESGGPMTPQAVVELINLHEAEFLIPSSDVVDLASAFAVEYRGAKMGQDLRRATAVARTLVGQYAEAFAMLEDIEKRDGTDSAAHVRNALVTILVREASDLELVQIVVPMSSEHSKSLEVELETLLADRLFEAGFIELANRTLHGSENSKNTQRQFLRARIALAQGLPKRAEVALLGLKGAEAEILRGRAKSLAGNHLEAAVRYGLANQTELQAEEAWLAGDWQTISLVGKIEHREFADMKKLSLNQDLAQKDVNEDHVLAQNQNLVNSSQHLRSVSSKVMTMYPVSTKKVR